MVGESRVKSANLKQSKLPVTIQVVDEEVALLSKKVDKVEAEHMTVIGVAESFVDACIENEDTLKELQKLKSHKVWPILKELADLNNDGKVDGEDLKQAADRSTMGGINFVIAALATFILTVIFSVLKEWIFEGTEQWSLLYYVLSATLPTFAGILIIKPVFEQYSTKYKLTDKLNREQAVKIVDQAKEISEMEHGHEKLIVDMQYAHDKEMWNKKMEYELNIAAKEAIIEQLEKK